MTPYQRVLVIAVAAALMSLIVELIRRRRLREEYSVLWMMLGGTVVLLAISDTVRGTVSDLLGLTPAGGTAVAFLFGLFMCLISLHFTVKISQLTQQVKDLAQEVALLRGPPDDAP